MVLHHRGLGVRGPLSVNWDPWLPIFISMLCNVKIHHSDTYKNMTADGMKNMVSIKW